MQFLPLTPFILLLVFLLLRYKMEPLPVIVVSCIITLLVSVYFLKTANAKKLKAQLLRDEEQYSNMLGEVEDYAILMLDTEGNIRNWNKGAERIKGYSAKEAIGKNFRMFYTRSDQEARLPEKLLGIAILQGRTA
ncbi:MAG: PAS domain S-box protein, partial [Bacteroidota bacterium]